jgi:hypothetical protein
VPVAASRVVPSAWEYSHEGFDFGSGGSRVARRELVAARREPLDVRRKLVDASW